MLPVSTKFLLAAFLTFAMTTSFAELADHDQPVNLEADRVTVDDSKQISTFMGNVRLSKGSLLILGDKIVVKQDKDGFMQVSAFGRPASFKQKREGSNGFVEGFGEIIEYDANAETILLQIQAKFKRDLDEVTGENITYNSKTEIFQVNGSNIELKNHTPQRVRAVLQPKPKAVIPPTTEEVLIQPTNSVLPEN